MDSCIHLYRYKPDVLNILLAAGGTFKNSYYAADILDNASWQNRSDIVKLLIGVGVDPDDWRDNIHIPLITACEHGSINVVKLLIKAGCDLDARGWKGRTALMTATYHGYYDIVRLLIEAGADVTATNSHCDTALDIARIKERKHTTDILERAIKEQGHVVRTLRQDTDEDDVFSIPEQKHVVIVPKKTYSCC